MKTKTILLALTLISLPLISFGQKWEHFKSKEGKFEIDFPVEPKVENTDGDDSKTVQLQATHNEVIYMASAVIHETNLDVEGLSPEKLSQASLEAFANVMGGEMKSNGDFKLGKNKGRECVIDNSEKGFMCYYKVIIIGQVQYQVIVMNAPANDDKKSRAKFFSSFEVSK
jgi:hypothetical protein